jgi:hypothetical protein
LRPTPQTLLPLGNSGFLRPSGPALTALPAAMPAAVLHNLQKQKRIPGPNTPQQKSGSLMRICELMLVRGGFCCGFATSIRDTWRTMMYIKPTDAARPFGRYSSMGAAANSPESKRAKTHQTSFSPLPSCEGFPRAATTSNPWLSPFFSPPPPWPAVSRGSCSSL